MKIQMILFYVLWLNGLAAQDTIYTVRIEEYGVPIVGVSSGPPYQNVIVGYFAPDSMKAGFYHFVRSDEHSTLAIMGQYGAHGANGSFVYYRANGQVEKIETYVNGKGTGIMIKFSENGSVVNVKYFFNNMPVGPSYIIKEDLIDSYEVDSVGRTTTLRVFPTCFQNAE